MRNIKKSREVMAKRTTPENLHFTPLTSEQWPDVENLFGPKGACCGCWCMYWRLPNKTFESQKGELNRLAFKNLVEENEIPGVLAFSGEMPVGWCAIAPRQHFLRLEHSRILKPVDERAVWSINCLFVQTRFRNQGVSIGLIKAAIDLGRKKGAEVLEAYPIDPKNGRQPDAFVYTGLMSAYSQVGFIEVLRRSPTRPIMRYYL